MTTYQNTGVGGSILATEVRDEEAEQVGRHHRRRLVDVGQPAVVTTTFVKST